MCSLAQCDASGSEETVLTPRPWPPTKDLAKRPRPAHQVAKRVPRVCWDFRPSRDAGHSRRTRYRIGGVWVLGSGLLGADGTLQVCLRARRDTHALSTRMFQSLEISEPHPASFLSDHEGTEGHDGIRMEPSIFEKAGAKIPEMGQCVNLRYRPSVQCGLLAAGQWGKSSPA